MIESVVAALFLNIIRKCSYYVINFDDTSKETDSITSGSSIESKTLIISCNNAKELQTFAQKS